MTLESDLSEGAVDKSKRLSQGKEGLPDEIGPSSHIESGPSFHSQPHTNVSQVERHENSSNGKKKLRKKQIANRARHRLLSIHRDAEDLVKTIFEVLPNQVCESSSTWPIYPNERCGTWYVSPQLTRNEGRDARLKTCYFKSTDGHSGTWNVSLKRLNLHLVKTLSESGGCIVVDSSVRKCLPDSLSRTIPIWACALNRLVLKYREVHPEWKTMSHSNPPTLCNGMWDTQLYTPDTIVTAEEHDQITALMEERVDTMYLSQAVVNPLDLVRQLTKPIRAIWITNNGQLLEPIEKSLRDQYLVVVCVNPSSFQMPVHSPRILHPVVWTPLPDNRFKQPNHGSERGFYYTPGAADDQESWARHLTPNMFWKHADSLLDPELADEQVDERIDFLVSTAEDNHVSACDTENQYNRIGNLNVWIGTRRAGRPPLCWDRFDAILNVTDQDYDDILSSIVEQEGLNSAHLSSSSSSRFYLKLPVAEGKRDRIQLERWLPVGLLFLLLHIQKGRRILVHCNQGKDRSVAVVMALVSIACRLVYPLNLYQQIVMWNIDDLVPRMSVSDSDTPEFYGTSAIRTTIVDRLLQDDGRELFLSWVHSHYPSKPKEPLANKESLRIALHLIRQDREVADPSRSTMQKLNRFFMSSPLYR